MGLTTIKMHVSNLTDKSRQKEVTFLVDSGALFSFVNKGILKEYGCKYSGIDDKSSTMYKNRVPNVYFELTAFTTTTPARG